MAIRVAIITVSDKGSRGERKDEAGPLIEKVLKERLEVQVVFKKVVPDEIELIKKSLLEACDLGADLVITTGGTGVSPRDVTPEATKDVIEKELPGFSEVMRIEGFKKTPHAIISRGVCGLRGRSLIINLPGSPRAVRESLEVILAAIPHTLEKLKGDTTECGQEV